MKVDWEHRLFTGLRLATGTAAFGLAFAHTVTWLAKHEIDGAAGVITASCIDILALVCLRGLTITTSPGMRAAHGLGFTSTLLLSLVAQVEEGSNGRGAGPLLSAVPVAAFAFLTVMHEVETRLRLATARLGVQVSGQPGEEVSSAPVAHPPLGTPPDEELVTRKRQGAAEEAAQRTEEEAGAASRRTVSEAPETAVQTPARTVRKPVARAVRKTSLEAVTATVRTHLAEHGRLPSPAELKLATGASESTVTRALRTVRDGHGQTVKPQARAAEGTV